MPQRPPPRASYVPGAKKPEPGGALGKVGTQMVRAADVKRDAREQRRLQGAQEAEKSVKRTPEPPPRVAARGLKRDQAAAPQAAASSAGEAPSPVSVAPGGSPFGQHGVRSSQLTAAPSGNSSAVLAIVFGLGFVMLAAVFLAVLIGVGAMWQGGYFGGETVETVADAGHMIDDVHGDAGPRALDPSHPDWLKQQRARQAAASQAAAVEAARGPDFAHIQVRIGDDTAFRSMEVNCPGGLRVRGTFSNKVARANNIPTSEVCTVTFQGAVKTGVTRLRGGSTVECVFPNTTVCKPY